MGVILKIRFEYVRFDHFKKKTHIIEYQSDCKSVFHSQQLAGKKNYITNYAYNNFMPTFKPLILILNFFMDKKKQGLIEQDGNIILNESGTFLSTDRIDENMEEKKNEVDEKVDTNSTSSAGPEEKDITD